MRSRKQSDFKVEPLEARILLSATVHDGDAGGGGDILEAESNVPVWEIEESFQGAIGEEMGEDFGAEVEEDLFSGATGLVFEETGEEANLTPSETAPDPSAETEEEAGEGLLPLPEESDETAD